MRSVHRGRDGLFVFWRRFCSFMTLAAGFRCRYPMIPQNATADIRLSGNYLGRTAEKEQGIVHGGGYKVLFLLCRAGLYEQMLACGENGHEHFYIPYPS